MKLSEKLAIAVTVGASMGWGSPPVFHSGKHKSSLSRIDRKKRKKRNKAARAARRINRLKAA